LLLGVLCLPLLAFRRGALWAVRLWARLTLWGLKAFAGLRVDVRGLQHRPKGAALIAAKHQGELDGIAPFVFLDDPCFVLKKELMRLPILGWYAARSGMIPIDRDAGSKAVRTLSADARDRLREERQIIIFPEGTRQEPGAPPDYKSGVAALYRDLGFACTPMATNSGLFWPARGFLRRPGVAVYEFLEPIPAGLKRADFMRTLEARIEAASNALLPVIPDSPEG
jgi:1-acyl-sn-glycerol-3-phosphate acyltransferase